MAAQLESSGSAQGFAASGSFDVDITITTTKNNRFLIAFVCQNNDTGDSSVTSVVYDPTGANQALSFYGNFGPIFVYTLTAPTIGASKTLRLTVDSVSGACSAIFGAFAFNDVHQVSPIGQTNTAGDISANASVTVNNTENNGFILGIVADANATGLTTSTPLMACIEVWDRNLVYGIAFAFMTGLRKASDGNVLLASTLSRILSWTMLGLEIRSSEFYRTIVESPTPRNVSTPDRLATPTRIAAPTRFPPDPVIPNPVLMNQATVGGSGVTTSSTLSLPNINSTGVNRLLLVFISYTDVGLLGYAPSAVDFGGTPLTRVHTFITSTIGPDNTYLISIDVWYLVAPPVIDSAINGTFSGPVGYGAVARFYTGVNQSVIFGNQAAGDFSGQTNGDLIVGGTQQLQSKVVAGMASQNTSASAVGTFAGGEFNIHAASGGTPTVQAGLTTAEEEGYSGITPIQIRNMIAGANAGFAVELLRA